MRPLPSRKGWIVSNCTCVSAALMSGGALGLVVQEALECAEAFVQTCRRRRHEQRVAGPGAADPVLRAPKLAGLLARAAPCLSRSSCISRISRSESGKSAPDPLEAMLIAAT